MSAKLILIVAFSVAYSRAQENNHICECDTDQDLEDNKAYWNFLKKLSDTDVPDDMTGLYAISPGSLYQFDCSHCDEKLRRKRKIEVTDLPEVEAPVEVATEEDEDDEASRRYHDLRCPKGYLWVIHHCLSKSEVDSYWANN